MSESDFVQVAVGRYADTCIPPTKLQIDCPYAVTDGLGRSCQLECRTVQRQLLRVNREGVSRSSFDAGMVLQTSKAQSRTPNALWHPSALLTVLRKVMRSAPFITRGHLHRTVDGTQTLGELAHLGLDPHALLGAFAEEYSIGLDASISLDVGPSASAERSSYRDGWATLRDAMYGSTKTAGELNPEFSRAVANWVRQGDPEAVIDRRPPDVLPSDGNHNDSTAGAEYRWLITRLTETYLDDWSQEALEAEFRYITCVWQPSTIPTTLIALRAEARASVADALARKVLSNDSDPATFRIRAAFTQQAIGLVQLGDTQGATTLLKVACELHPGDWMLANNYGFCLIPSDPDLAMIALAKAGGMAVLSSSVPLIEANKAMAMIRAGHFVEAAGIIAARSADQVPEDQALLWVAPGVTSLANAPLEASFLPLRDYWELLRNFLVAESPS